MEFIFFVTLFFLVLYLLFSNNNDSKPSDTSSNRPPNIPPVPPVEKPQQPIAQPATVTANPVKASTTYVDPLRTKLPDLGKKKNLFKHISVVESRISRHIYVYSFKVNRTDCIGIVTQRSSNGDQIVIPKEKSYNLYSSLEKCLKDNHPQKFIYDLYDNKTKKVYINITAEKGEYLIYKELQDKTLLCEFPLRLGKQAAKELIAALREADGMIFEVPKELPDIVDVDAPIKKPVIYTHSLPLGTNDIEIEFTKLVQKITVCESYNCTCCHPLENVIAKIRVYYLNGEKEDKLFPAGYCKRCKRYFVAKRVYKNLLEDGFALDVTYILEEGAASKKEFGGFNPESPLFKLGYNVKQTENLSSKQRQEKLAFAIDYGIMTKGEIINHIENQIEKNRNKKNATSYELAISKWAEDIVFVNNYKRITKQFKYVQKQEG